MNKKLEKIYPHYENADKIIERSCCIPKELYNDTFVEIVIKSLREMLVKKIDIGITSRKIESDFKVWKKSTAYNSVVDEIKVYIQNNLTKKLDMEEISRNAKMSYGFLSKVFKIRTGLRVSDYLMSVRMEKARKMLINNRELNISEIGVQSGFKDPLYFSRVFRKANGLAPLEYRKTKGKQADS